MVAATLILRDKRDVIPDLIKERVVWIVPAPIRPSVHHYKYRLFFGRTGQRLIGYDNERGKGDHRHNGDQEEAYVFTGLEQLLGDFEANIKRWLADYDDLHRDGR